MNTTYRVVIGGLKEGFSKDQVNINLANLFKTTIDKLPDISSESNYVVKKNLDKETAEKYQSAIEMQGCKCFIEAESDMQLTLDESPEKISAKSDTKDTNSSQTNPCKVCGFALPISSKFCKSCGAKQDGSADILTSKPVLPHESLNATQTAKVQAQERPVTNSKKSKFMIAGGLALVIIIGWQISSLTNIFKHSNKLQNLASSCGSIDIYGQSLKFRDTKLADESPIKDDDVCQAAEEFSEKNKKILLATLMCDVVDETVNRLGRGDVEAGVREAEHMANSGNPDAISLMNRYRPCTNENSREVVLKSIAKDMGYAIYSVGTFTWEGKTCKGYLAETANTNSKGYDLHGIGPCKSIDVYKGANVHHPEKRPAGIPAGDYFKKTLAYDGELPETWIYHDREYKFTSPTQIQSSSPEKPVEVVPVTYTDESTDTVAGKFTIRRYDDFSGHRKTFLNGKEILKCDNDDCGDVSYKVDKSFNYPDKTILLTSYGNGGNACDGFYELITISKNGSYLKPEAIGNCAELTSAIQSGSKITLTFPTNEQNMQGTEVWVYEGGKVTGPLKTIKPIFDVSPEKIHKITTGDDVYNSVSGTVVKENNGYYLRLDNPVKIVDDPNEQFPGYHNGDITDVIEITLGYKNNQPVLPKLGKGTFDISFSCSRASCSIDKINLSSSPSASEKIIPSSFQGVWADDNGCKQYKANREIDPGAIITSDHIDRYEHECALNKVIASTENTFSGEFTCTQEGETMTENISITLQPDGKLAGIFNNPLPMCKTIK
ncbi:MAG TPA: hypothetical protein VIO87_00860 [Methylotenera sp.]